MYVFMYVCSQFTQFDEDEATALITCVEKNDRWIINYGISRRWLVYIDRGHTICYRAADQ